MDRELSEAGQETESGAAYPLWDLPVRLIHWSLVVYLPLAWWSAEEGNMDLHGRVGYTVLVLVATRLVWGLVGSRHARFSDFLVGPRAILHYLKGQGARSRGHNPLGGWAVLVLLGLLLAQATSGLFNSDDIMFNGPFYYAASTGFRDRMGVVHEYAFDLLVVFVALHLAAVLFHQLRLKEKLIQAMIRGKAQGREGQARPVSLILALVIAAALAGGLAVGIEYAPRPQPINPPVHCCQ